MLAGNTSGSFARGSVLLGGFGTGPSPPRPFPAHGWYVPLERGSAWELGGGTGGGHRVLDVFQVCGVGTVTVRIPQKRN